MGRVYDALKRAAESGPAEKRNGNGNGNASGKAASVEKGIAPVASNGRNGSHAAVGSHAENVPASVADARAVEVKSVAAVAEESDAPEVFLRNSRHFKSPETAHISAPTEHTGTDGGSALSAATASRAAGATLGAAGSARTPEFVTLDISAARVEPHLVAITQPRSGHAERFRSLRTRVLHAGERRKMQAFVVTSAGVMEGKTLTAINLSWLLAQTDQSTRQRLSQYFRTGVLSGAPSVM